MSRISVLSPLDPPTHILQNPRSSSSQRLRASTDLQLLLSDAVLSTSFAKVYSDDNLYRTWCTIWPIIGTAEGLDGQMGKNIVQCVGMTVGLLNNSLMVLLFVIVFADRKDCRVFKCYVDMCGNLSCASVD